MNINLNSAKSENLHFDGIFLSKVCNIWAKIIQTRCVVKNDLRCQKWHEEFSEFSHKQLKAMLDKSFVYVLAEGMYFLDKFSPLNFNFLDFPLLVWSYPNYLCDFWNQESAFV